MSRDISKSIKSKLSPLNCHYSMEQELYTIQLTRRELGLIKQYQYWYDKDDRQKCQEIFQKVLKAN